MGRVDRGHLDCRLFDRTGGESLDDNQRYASRRPVADFSCRQRVHHRRGPLHVVSLAAAKLKSRDAGHWDPSCSSRDTRGLVNRWNRHVIGSVERPDHDCSDSYLRRGLHRFDMAGISRIDWKFTFCRDDIGRCRTRDDLTIVARRDSRVWRFGGLDHNWRIGDGRASALAAETTFAAQTLSQGRGTNAVLLGVTSFSLAILASYAAFMLRQFPNSWLSIADATLPGFILLAALSRDFISHRARPKFGLAADAIRYIVAIAAASIVVPSLQSMGWLWAWAIAFGATSAIAGLISRRVSWFAIAIAPIGLATVLCAPMVGGMPWATTPLWRKLIGGEPMVAAGLVGILGYTISRIIDRLVALRPGMSDSPALRYGAIGWLAYSALVACILIVSPVEWMGIVPPVVISVLLGCISLGAFNMLHLTPLQWAARATVLASTIGFWMSVLRPIQFGEAFAGSAPLVLTLTASALTLLIMGECKPLLRSSTLHLRFAAPILSGIGASVALFAFLTGESVDSLGMDASLQAITALGCTGIVLAWVGFGDRQTGFLACSRIAVCLMALLICDAYFHPYVMTLESFRDGRAWWSWAVVLWSISLLISLRNGILTWVQANLVSDDNDASLKQQLTHRLGWYKSCEHEWDDLSTLAIFVFGISMTVVATSLSFADLAYAAALETTRHFDLSLTLPAMVFAAAGLQLALQSNRHFSTYGRVKVGEMTYLACVIGWISVELGTRIFALPSQSLILATSLASICFFVIDGLMTIRTARDESDHNSGLLTMIGLTIVTTSSIALLSQYWYPNVVAGHKPSLLITASVTTWWIASAAASGWIGHRKRSTTLAIISAILIPMCVLLIAPSFESSTLLGALQVAAISSGIYAIVIRVIGARLPEAIQLSLVICTAAGILNCVLVTIGILTSISVTNELHSAIGLTLLALSIGLLIKLDRITDGPGRQRLPLDLMGLLASGHLALFLTQLPFPWITEMLALKIVWTFIAGTSVIRLSAQGGAGQGTDRYVRFQTTSLIVVTTLLCIFGGSSWIDDAVGLLACAIGLLTTIDNAKRMPVASNVPERPVISMILPRLFANYVLVAGAVLAGLSISATNHGGDATTSISLIWIAACATVWRIGVPDGSRQTPPRRKSHLLADREASLLLFSAIAIETILVFINPNRFVSAEIASNPWLWLRLLAAGLAVITVCTRFRRIGTLEIASLTMVLSFALIAIRIAIEHQAGEATVLTAVSLSVSFVFALLAFCGQSFCQAINVGEDWSAMIIDRSKAHRPPEAKLSIVDWSRAMTRTGSIVALLVIGLCGVVLVGHNSEPVTRVAICSIAVLALTAGELADRGSLSRLRYVAVVFALLAIAMWSSTGVAEHPLAVWVIATRWFVGWVCIAGLFAFAVPKLLSESALDKWKGAIRTGLILAGGLAIASLVTALGYEFQLRIAGQTDRLDKPLYLGMAIVLGMVTLLITVAAILSGPGFKYRSAWDLSDRQRAGLVIAAQLFGGLTWFHLFLCKSPLASLGLRAYWPYVVMTLSFASVGISEWARRRNDQVLSTTIKQTALFLPLIPVLGFWLSGSLVTAMFGQSESGPWTYINGRVSYQAVLVSAAIYYGMISMLWKSAHSRLVSIVLGNAALWVVLIQIPGWDFLAHPQAWLIPPSVCVLAATHLHRERLGRETAQAIRYATTLVIYISSTADMLIQGIGTTIEGPIILILLALAGAAAGVILHVRPFLYLGTTFVFVGVTSMVWHAGQQMDAVWPWWVFGIGTGVLLMIGLMAIEKNKPQLKRLAASLQQWEA